MNIELVLMRRLWIRLTAVLRNAAFEVNENSRLIGCLRTLFKFTLSLPRSAKPQNVSRDRNWFACLFFPWRQFPRAENFGLFYFQFAEIGFLYVEIAFYEDVFASVDLRAMR